MQKESLHLLQTRRFLPLFITQFLEAFNDNLFKTALVILITYTVTTSAASAEMLVAAAMGIFILPFFLFSATAGQLADKYERALLIRIIKATEILAMALGVWGFYTHNVPLLMFTLFLLGTHSTFFGPIKYSILPDHLKAQELIGANALIEASTFLSILFGTIVGGILIGSRYGITLVSSLGLICAIAGLAASFYIPRVESNQKNLKISLNFIKETFNIIRTARENKDIFLCILGISWFWLIGATFITIFPILTKSVLNADSNVVTLFLGIFSVGIGLGSMLCEQVQKKKIDARFVPLGILGMTIFTIDLFFAVKPVHVEQLIGISAFVRSFHNLRIMLDMFLLAVCGGLFVVPLYAIIQHFSKRAYRSRIIAVNNIFNALFMVAISLIIMLTIKLGMSVASFLLLIGMINLAVAVYICKLLPDALVKSFIAWILKLCYRVKIEGMENYEKASAKSIIVANHVSYLDGIILSAFLPDRVLFAIHTQIASQWWIKPILRLVDAFPIDPTNPMAMKSLIANIRRNRRCFIFPEGRLTVTGGLMKIYEGPGLIADKTDADIIPIRIGGAQYSHFSRLKNKVRTRWFPQITLHILPARKFRVDPSIKGRERRDVISHKFYDLMTDLIFESSPYKKPIMNALIDASKAHGKKRSVVEDIQRTPLNYQQLLGRIFILGNYMARHSQPREVIGILMPNMVATVVCFFGVHCYGRVPALLNFSAGTRNVRAACQTAQIKTVYTSKKFVETANLEECVQKLKEDQVQVVFLEDLKEKITILHKLSGLLKGHFAEYFYRKNNPGATEDDTGVILFTSGSEGNPKGVVLSHKNILANCYQMSARVDFSQQDIAFNILPMFHAFGLTAGTLLPLVSGIKTFLYPSPLHYRIVPELVYDTNATIFFGTDTFLSGYAKHAHPYDFYSVRYVFAGAEKLKPETVRIWNEKFGIRLFEGYGATEAAPVVSTNTPMHNRSGTVGRFLPNMSYKLTLVPGIAEGGRLAIAGPNIMRGYIFSDKPGQIQNLEDQWYDTGDIVSVDQDGFITIQGRAKRFAKIGGEMVSLTAVESQVAALWPDCLHAVVTIPDAKKGETLVLVTENPHATREEMIQYFKKHDMSELFIPKQILHIQEMFILGSGKVDFVAAQEYAVEKLI